MNVNKSPLLHIQAFAVDTISTYAFHEGIFIELRQYLRLLNIQSLDVCTRKGQEI